MSLSMNEYYFIIQSCPNKENCKYWPRSWDFKDRFEALQVGILDSLLQLGQIKILIDIQTIPFFPLMKISMDFIEMTPSQFS